ncbi:DUF1178 family protein [Anianabacter salinae]|uniref:DUF1178 family protein n=1 Tax=Anianabacter salinae TaxID=2851023 RepID=UPI00225DF26E|nr:DUF1178 family protein [Anianabacter salinae]MBV0912665.1 DUF1178 family protein [Anianabacter salinae]
MIRYALKCSNAHDFESWFQSSGAYDTLRASGHVACPNCGDTVVDKALMAPGVPAARRDERTVPALSAPSHPLEEKLRKMRAEVEKNAEYVGTDFARQARAIHDGERDSKPIWGEARPDEARRLIEDGVPVAPLPFMPTRKAN